MEIILLSSILIGVIAVILGIIVSYLMKKKKDNGIAQEPDYQTFYLMGIIWIPVGVVFMTTINPVIGIAFMAIGISYLAIGLANIDKWNKKKNKTN
jgi:uncharacterized membrane protein